jgi:two-component system sensor histidine kinase HydH
MMEPLRSAKATAQAKLAIVSPARKAVVLAALYIVVCSLYIVFSSKMAAAILSSPEQLRTIETFKGVAFVIVSGLLFFAIAYEQWLTIQRQEEKLVAQQRSLIQGERRAVAAMCAASVAHDLNNLLMALSGLVEGLRAKETEDPFLRTMRESIENSIANLAHLARRTASTASQVLPDVKSPVALDSVLPQVVALARKHPAVRECEVTVSALPPVALTCNQTLLEEAVLNLLINAAQATGPHGAIELRLERSPGTVVVAVHDSGPGVPDAIATNIFDPCFTTKAEGTGLGLLAVKAFAASNDAQVSVGRSPLGGAVFQIRIPVAE